jgi:hypothetical protein
MIGKSANDSMVRSPMIDQQLLIGLFNVAVGGVERQRFTEIAQTADAQVRVHLRIRPGVDTGSSADPPLERGLFGCGIAAPAPPAGSPRRPHRPE